jgi:hypothetical protein
MRAWAPKQQPQTYYMPLYYIGGPRFIITSAAIVAAPGRANKMGKHTTNHSSSISPHPFLLPRAGEGTTDAGNGLASPFSLSGHQKLSPLICSKKLHTCTFLDHFVITSSINSYFFGEPP